jgi:hypothetical protein
MRTLLALIIIVLLASCGSQQPVFVGKDTVVKDSTVTTESFQTRIDTIYVPGDTVRLVADIDRISEKPIIVDNGRIMASLSRKLDKIQVECLVDDLEYQIELKDKIIEKLISSTKTETITLPPVEVPYVPWHIEILAWIGGLSLLYFGIRIGLKFIKP